RPDSRAFRLQPPLFAQEILSVLLLIDGHHGSSFLIQLLSSFVILNQRTVRPARGPLLTIVLERHEVSACFYIRDRLLYRYKLARIPPSRLKSIGDSDDRKVTTLGLRHQFIQK